MRASDEGGFDFRTTAAAAEIADLTGVFLPRREDFFQDGKKVQVGS